MMKLLFSADRRINRGAYWKYVGISLVASLALALVNVLLWQLFPGELINDGHGSLSVSVTGVKAIPYLVIGGAFAVFSLWAGVCTGIKRFHDRDKPGIWMLILFIPVVGAIWFFVEVGCLKGTLGPNKYGPDPLDQRAREPAYA